MVRYFIKRLVFVVPTVFFISILTFILSSWVPGDPAEMILSRQGSKLSSESYTKSYLQIRERLGLNLPKFYIEIKSPYWPGPQDTLTDKQYNFIEILCFEYKSAVAGKLIWAELIKLSAADTLVNLNAIIEGYEGDFRKVLRNLENRKENISKLFDLTRLINKLESDRKSRWLNIPKVYWNGTNNQFHIWFKGVLCFDFGNSYLDNRKVAEIIFPALENTLLLCILSLFFSYPLAIIIGVKLAINKNKRLTAIIQNILFSLYSIPEFWLATLLIFFLAGGDFLNVFPAFGLGDLPPEATFWDRFWEKAYHLVLPVFCYSYSGLALIAKQMKTGVEQNLQLDYVRTAFAKGLSFNYVIWKHVFKNSIIPILSLFASTLPYLLSGSMVLEYIFSISGVGKLAFDSLLNRDYAVVFGIVYVVSIITIFGNILADGLLFLVDPRISIQESSGNP